DAARELDLLVVVVGDETRAPFRVHATTSPIVTRDMLRISARSFRLAARARGMRLPLRVESAVLAAVKGIPSTVHVVLDALRSATETSDAVGRGLSEALLRQVDRIAPGESQRFGALMALLPQASESFLTTHFSLPGGPHALRDLAELNL